MNRVRQISVCIGSSCHVRGAYNVVQAIQQMMEERGLHDRIELGTTFCMRACHQAGVSVSVDGQVHRVAPEAVRQFVDAVMSES